MAGTTLSELQRRFYDRMDEGASQYITTAQATDVINEAYCLLWSLYSNKSDKFFETEATITPLVNTRDYPLPTDFRSETAVYWNPTVGATPALTTHVQMRRTNRRAYAGVPSVYGYYYPTGQYIPTYDILGNVLRITPTPTVAPTFGIQLWYNPNYVPLALSTDTIDSRIYPGHDQFIINQAAIMIKIGKEEVVADDLAIAQQNIKAMIDADLNNRFQGESISIMDTDPYDGWVA